jgi:DNA invertase Pin-like site-specific DNA recombinase
VSDTIGYSRTATEASPDIESELRAAGATRVIWNSPATTRSTLASAIDSASPGDTLIVVSSDDLSPSVEHFVQTVGLLDERGIRLRSLTEPQLSTDGAQASPAEVLRALEQLRRRLFAAQAAELVSDPASSGRRPGRPSVMTEEKIGMAKELRRQNRSIAQIARAVGVSSSAVRRALHPPSS